MIVQEVITTTTTKNRIASLNTIELFLFDDEI